MKRLKHIKRGLIYFAVAVVLSIANVALNSAETEIDNTVDPQLAVAVTQQTDLK